MSKIITLFLCEVFLFIISLKAQPAVIDTFFFAKLGNIEQAVFIKGRDRVKPVLLILHGGPGFSDFYLWQSYNQPLEDYYTVVTWDQRGSGLSYNDSIPVESMTFDQIASDAHELTVLLKNLF